VIWTEFREKVAKIEKMTKNHPFLTENEPLETPMRKTSFLLIAEEFDDDCAIDCDDCFCLAIQKNFAARQIKYRKLELLL
jgi:hypothetical protein